MLRKVLLIFVIFSSYSGICQDVEIKWFPCPEEFLLSEFSQNSKEKFVIGGYQRTGVVAKPVVFDMNVDTIKASIEFNLKENKDLRKSMRGDGSEELFFFDGRIFTWDIKKTKKQVDYYFTERDSTSMEQLGEPWLVYSKELRKFKGFLSHKPEILEPIIKNNKLFVFELSKVFGNDNRDKQIIKCFDLSTKSLLWSKKLIWPSDKVLSRSSVYITDEGEISIQAISVSKDLSYKTILSNEIFYLYPELGEIVSFQLSGAAIITKKLKSRNKDEVIFALSMKENDIYVETFSLLNKQKIDGKVIAYEELRKESPNNNRTWFEKSMSKGIYFKGIYSGSTDNYIFESIELYTSENSFISPTIIANILDDGRINWARSHNIAQPSLIYEDDNKNPVIICNDFDAEYNSSGERTTLVKTKYHLKVPRKITIKDKGTKLEREKLEGISDKEYFDPYFSGQKLAENMFLVSKKELSPKVTFGGDNSPNTFGILLLK